MFHTKIFLFLYSLHVCKCDWVSEWMEPVREKVKQNELQQKAIEDDVNPSGQQPVQQASGEYPAYVAPQSAPSIVLHRNKINLKTKLEETLNSAEELLEKLQTQILLVEKKEKILKDTIANGRSGISTVTVNTVDRPPRTYFIREGIWSVCNGMVQYPASAPPNANLLSDVFSGPRCIGQEIISTTDQCVFNSVIKYQTVPDRRSASYKENEFFCLKPSFNKSLEQFLSVPKKIVNETCKEGTIRSLGEQHNRCGSRILSEYSYYPRTTPTSFPMEYCNEKDGSCRLLIAWHLSNTSADNYEFVRQEDNFKKYFIQPTGPYLTQVI